MKYIKAVAAVMSMAAVIGMTPAFASQNTSVVTVPSGHTVAIPSRAVEIAPGLFSLGSAIDPISGDAVEGFAIVHYKEAKEKSSINAARPAKPTACYGFLADGAKWKSVEPWVMNAANNRSLDPGAVFNNVVSDIAKWTDAADGTVGSGVGVTVIGTGTATSQTLTVDSTAPDGANEVYFGAISDSNAIAVTTVWGVFSGPVNRRSLVEWDMVFDQIDYDWTLGTANAAAMDFESIATHELGHAHGLADLYNASCNAQTMYGYAGNGETNKQTLESGDIAGISSLY
jgi:hypothetical protein